jgi:hypothetical protein
LHVVLGTVVSVSEVMPGSFIEEAKHSGAKDSSNSMERLILTAMWAQLMRSPPLVFMFVKGKNPPGNRVLLPIRSSWKSEKMPESQK